MARARIVSVFALIFALSEAEAAEPDPMATDTPPDADPSGQEARRAAELPVLVVLVGAGARARRIHLDIGDGAGGSAPRSFETGAYLDFGWHALARPWARRSAQPALAAIVFQLDGGSGVGFTVEPEQTGISLRTNAWRLIGQAGYLYPLGRLRVGGLVGVGADLLEIDLNAVLPSSRIVYARLGPAVAADLVRSWLEIRVDFGLRFPFTLGNLADSFGADSSAFGLDAALMLGGRVDPGFSYALRLGWSYYRMRFSGAVEDVPSSGEGGTGTDHALTIQVLVGWSL